MVAKTQGFYKHKKQIADVSSVHYVANGDFNLEHLSKFNNTNRLLDDNNIDHALNLILNVHCIC